MQKPFKSLSTLYTLYLALYCSPLYFAGPALVLIYTQLRPLYKINLNAKMRSRRCGSLSFTLLKGWDEGSAQLYMRLWNGKCNEKPLPKQTREKAVPYLVMSLPLSNLDLDTHFYYSVQMVFWSSGTIKLIRDMDHLGRVKWWDTPHTYLCVLSPVCYTGCPG